MDESAEEPVGPSSSIDATIAEFVRGLGLPLRRDDEQTPSPDATIADHFEVVQRLGAGAKGVVFLARDTRLRRTVAVKLVAAGSPAAAARAEREAQAMARLSHPNVLAVHEVGQWREFVFIAMEYVDGGTLRRWQSMPERRWPEIVAAYVQAARGLHAAHLVGLVHRDFKPDNALIGDAIEGGIGRVRVGDFGLARTADDADAGIAGTAPYIAPEQVLARLDGPLADQFAFGVSLYEALCGRRPYAVRDSWTATPGDLRAPDPTLPPWLRAALVRALELAPQARFADLEVLADALERGLTRASRRRNAAVVAGAIGLTAIVGLTLGSWLARPDPLAQCLDPAIENAWTPERGDAIALAFVHSGSPIAAQAYDDVEHRLDAWSTEFSAQRDEACRAMHEGTQSPMLFERRLACLDRRNAETDGILEQLAQADRDTVARSLDLVAELPALDDCADTERLLAAVAPPADPELATLVDHQRRELDRARALFRLGRHPDVSVIAEAVRSSDAAARHPPLYAEAAFVLGMGRYGAHEFIESEAALESSFGRAIAAGDDELVARAARQLVCAAGAADGGTERGRRWVAIAEAAAERIQANDRERVELLSCRARMHLDAGEPALAIDVVEKALATLGETEADDVLPGTLHHFLGNALKGVSKFERARDELELAHALFRAARGDAHPTTLEANSSLALVLEELGEPGVGLRFQLDALQNIILLQGAESAAAASAYRRVALALGALNARRQAIAYLERGAAVAAKLPAQERTEMALATDLSHYLLEQGEVSRAVALAERAIELSEVAWGHMNEKTAVARARLAAALAIAGDPTGSRRELMRALEIFDATLGETSLDSGLMHLNLAAGFATLGPVIDFDHHIERAERAAIASGDERLAAGVLTARAEAARRRHDFTTARALQARAAAALADLDPIQRRAQLYRLGLDQLELGEHADALASFEQARALAEGAGNRVRVAAGEFGMARAAWELGDRARARVLATSALDVLVEVGADQEAIAEVRTWLSRHRAATRAHAR